MAANLRQGQRYRLNCPDNDRLHDAECVVSRLTDYGAVVACAAAASGEYRALASELVPAGTKPDPGKSGYTGNTCEKCGSFRMVRAGACECCQDCGTSGGCG